MRTRFQRMALSCCLLFAAGSAMAEDIATAVKARLADAAVVRGDFEQQKTLAGFRKPAVSRGNFLIARDRGVLWVTTSPFSGSLRLTRNEIVARTGDQQTMRLSASEQPGMQSVSRLLFGLLSGDLAPLADSFEIAGELRGAQGWQLALTPKTPALQKMFTRIDLEGDRYVRHVKLAESSGDSTDIRLSNVGSQPPALTADEVKRFE
ncbi:MAG: outer membrane lipoprotein carrier protein LolA [Rhodocyclaceae bacterium]